MKYLFFIHLFVFLFNTLSAQDNSPMAVHTKSSHVLYRNCSNPISIKLQLPCDNPAPTNDKIKFKADNATVIIDSIARTQFYLSIVPNKSAISLTLQALSDGNIVGEETFSVYDLPTPSVHFYTGGKEMAIKNGLYGIPKNITIKALLDEAITDMFDIKAEYIVSDFEITFAKKGTTLFQKEIKGNSIDLTAIHTINTADRIIISINEIKIITPEGKLETIRFGNSIFVAPIEHSY